MHSYLINSLYNGAYIDAYKYTKALVTSAYVGDKAKIEVVTAPTTEATDKAFVKRIRELHTRFQLPSTQFNAWEKVNAGVEGAFPIVTWSDASDIMVMIRADIEAEVNPIVGTEKQSQHEQSGLPRTCHCCRRL